MEKTINEDLKTPKNIIEESFNDFLDKSQTNDIKVNEKSEKTIENQFLNNKIKREEDKKDKKASKRNLLKKQLEFYFSDENLLHDKFLQKFLNKETDKGVPITIIENFNKVKEILNDVKELNARIHFIKEAVESSSILILNKKKNKIKRKIDFSLDNIDTDDIDERSIYVENLPNNINHSLLTTIFSRSGKVAHVSIPKFTYNQKPKGFGFIIFEVKLFFKFFMFRVNIFFIILKLNK